MRSWKPRVWPLTPHLAREYACVDARHLADAPTLPGIIGLRLTGFGVGLRASNGRLGLIDTSLRAVEPDRRATFLARLPTNAAQLVGFTSSAWVLRPAWRTPEGIVMAKFTTGAGLRLDREMLIDSSWIRGKLVALMDATAPGWSSWKRIAAKLERALTNKPGGVRLSLEAPTFPELRDKLAAAARVYGSIDEPGDLMDRAFLTGLPRSERREYQAAVRWARTKGLTPRDLAAVGGGAA